MRTFALPRPQSRPRGISILPLINVVFLLLIFIVLSGVISAPDPFALTAAESSIGEDVGAAESDATIYISATGEIRFRAAEGEAETMALVQSLAASGEVEALTLRADAGAPASNIIRLVDGLRAAGLDRVELQAERRN